jgi:aminoglycoside phosphotransferase (APT) family kinase protein
MPACRALEGGMMVAVPDLAEVSFDDDSVRRMLLEQHPDLADLPLVRVDDGYDNALWRLGSELVVRLPRRPLVPELLLNEQRWLPELAPRLPLPVPVPIRIGVPSQAFPWPWSVAPWLPGRPAHRTQITAPFGAARQLGGFLRSLHIPPPAAAPQNPRRSGPLREWTDHFESRVASLGARIDAERLRGVWKKALASAEQGTQPTWIHGDLQPANILVGDGKLSAIIDFSDICAGDPATDVAGFWMLLPGSAYGTFLAEYGHVDEDLFRRSLAWALLYALMFFEDVAEQSDLGRSIIARVLAAD